MRELMSVVRAQTAGPVGPWFSHHRSLVSDVFEFEISVPVSKQVQPTGRVHPGVLLGGNVVQATYVGPYDGLREAWSKLSDWMRSKGYTPLSNFWEAYAYGPESTDNSEEFQTVLSQPVADALINSGRTNHSEGTASESM